MNDTAKRVLKYSSWLVITALIGGGTALFFFPNRAAYVPGIQGAALIIAPFAIAIVIVMLMVLAASHMLKNSKQFSTSIVDPLTGLYNQKFFKDRLEVELERAVRSSESLSLAIIDIDDFRNYNNVYGHLVGDKVLAAVALGLRHNSRKPDTVCRIGGDEFAIIMPNTGIIDSQRICARIKDNAKQSVDGTNLKPRLSCGVANYPYHAREADVLNKYADDALYWAKYHGKDQVILFDFESMRSFNSEERLRRAEEIAYRNTAQTLAVALDARDDKTKGHAKNVAVLAEVFASRLNLSKHKIDMIRVAALVHDIGKISMYDIAAKEPSELTEADKTMLQEHVSLCEQILITTDLAAILPWVIAHHEQWDGGGYPAGLEGDQIPYEARIIALCDVYENLTRPRRDGTALSHQEAIGEIIKDRGRRFDPLLTDSFIHLLDLLNSMRMTESPRKTQVPAETGGMVDAEEPAETYNDLYALVRAKLR